MQHFLIQLFAGLRSQKRSEEFPRSFTKLKEFHRLLAALMVPLSQSSILAQDNMKTAMSIEKATIL